MHRKLLAATAAATVALTGGVIAAQHAGADPEPATVERSEAGDQYWACLALDHVDVGTCVSNPLPDLSGYPTVPDLLDSLIG